MRVLFYIGSDYENIGNPIVKRIQGLALSLIQFENDVTIICPNSKRDCFLKYKYDQFGIKYLKFRKRFNINLFALSFLIPGLNLYFFLKSFLKQSHFDLAVFYGSSVLNYWLSIHLCQKLKIKCISDLTEFYPISFKRFFSPNFWDHFFFRSVFIKKYDGSVAISKFYYDYLRRNKINVIRIPSIMLPNLEMDDKYFNKNKNFILTYIGSFSERDLPDTMINGIIEALKMGCSMSFVIIGNMSKEKKGRYWKSKIENDKFLSKHIIFPGWVSDLELTKLMMKSSAFILLRNNNIFSNACFATRIPEFFNTSKPIILSAIDEFTDLFKHNVDVFFIKPGNCPKELCNAILYFIKNRENVNELGKRGKQFADRFLTTKYLGFQLNNFFREIINKKLIPPNRLT